MSKDKIKTKDANQPVEKSTEDLEKAEYNKFQDEKMQEVLEVIRDNIDVFKRLADK